MVRNIVEQKVPEIRLIGKDELSVANLLLLNHIYKSDRSEFVACQEKLNIILLNKECEDIEHLKGLVLRLMDCKYLNQYAEKFLDEVKEKYGEKAADTLLCIWKDWREAQDKADLKEKAENELKLAKKCGAARACTSRKSIIKMLYSIGFGIYGDEAICDSAQGAQNCFMYGYYIGKMAAGRLEVQHE